jgi:hypothetical protein
VSGVIPARQRRRKRRQLRDRDGTDCFYCLRPLHADQTIEHLLDRQHGGTNALDNLVLVHNVCNEEVLGLSLEQKLLRRGDVLLAQMRGDDLTLWQPQKPIGRARSMVQLYQVAAIGVAGVEVVR